MFDESLKNRIEVLATNIRDNANVASEMFKQGDSKGVNFCLDGISGLAIKIIDELNNSNI